MLFFLGIVAVFALRGAAYSFFFNNTDFSTQIANISSGCATALQAPLDCDPYLTYVMTSNFYGSLGNDTLQAQFCNATCSNELTSYRTSVASSCAKDPQPVPGYPATYWADSAISAFNHMCMKDQSTGAFCVDVIAGFFANQATDEDGTSLPTSQLCSNCVVDLFRLMQSTSYSNYDDTLSGVWATIQSKCSLSYPTAVPTLATNVTQPGGFAIPGSGSSPICLSGITYTVVSGDNCEAIAEKYNVATGTLIAINNIYTDCTNLYVGQNLCIPPQCTTYLVQSGDTCDGIANKTSTTFQQLVAWNPAIGSYCTNLLSGQNICVSPPGGVQNLTTIAGATSTNSGIYASTTTSRPSPVASGTTLYCGKYYMAQLGDTCQLVSLNQTISLSLFEEINPDINAACSNLELGVYYCVQPTQNWNATVTSTITTAPTTTPTGTTADCFQYYVIQSGDYCAKIESQFAISMAQLMYWNPSLKSDCSNLALGEAYCVNGENQPPASTTAAAAGKRDVSASGAQKTPDPQIFGLPEGWPGWNAPNVARAYAAAKQIS
ncbi:carbohydrate-binding module family 50 protein [Xylona heveae TC161]|uniref:Carbohydrate-binding module family 50 protein n=1 Tax=Xylona heveae (strain CBS 132557 / TC161) TaxID=1328760 RepID=A0A165ACH0_XYLHT|nr:carbohydrate-binding module family 50 protein [Xylona heveae TC161]KZF20250.1 carbohydrate-binding module family 50 protein [Xylona heveae TC161]